VTGSLDRRGQPCPAFTGSLRVTEIFTSIQGESSRAGLPTTFVRLTGCGLRCSWCDTAYAFSGGEALDGGQILARVEAAGLRAVCLTGGEPLEQPGAGALLYALLERGYAVSVETGGHVDIGIVPAGVMAVVDVKCPGSAMERRNRWENLTLLRPGDELKLVLRDEADYAYARTFLRERAVPDGVGVLLSPVHGTLDPRELVAWVVRDRLGVRVNLQLHKYVWGPDVTGV
jgi:7-carboxy-7-deazaguanine synthase